jgi:hypothetical protein
VTGPVPVRDDAPVTSPPPLVLDHLLWAVPDLARGADRLTELSGVAPAPGGSHPGRGTANHLLGLGDERFLEVIGPDPDQVLVDTLGGYLATFPLPHLFTWCVRTLDAMATASHARDLGLSAEVVEGERLTPDGRRARWRNVELGDHPFGLAVPFAIEWATDTRHPSLSSPGGCSLLRFEVLHPDSDELRHLLDHLGLDVEVTHANEPGFTAMLDTPNGLVRLE